MKIIFTSSYKTYFKDNTKNYVTNYYALVFLIYMIFFSYNMRRREYDIIINMHVLRDSLQRTQLYTGSLRVNTYEVYCVPHHIGELISINVLKPYYFHWK